MGTERAFTADMHEISGFGGGYEDACRRMLLAGLKWVDEHPGCEEALKRGFREMRNVFGIVDSVNPEAKAVIDAIAGAAKDCTGAMVHACVHHLLAVLHLGWDKYCEEMRRPEESPAQ